MSSSDAPQAALRDAISDRKAVLVAGTGISISATFDAARRQSHPQASWSGLLKHGLAWLRAHDLIDDDDAQGHSLLLNTRSPQTHRLISAAQDIVAGMGGLHSRHFKAWLNETIGTIAAKDRSVLDAIHALREHGNLLATTNYDSLLLDDSTSLTPVTWRDTDALVGAVRRWDTSKLIFLHGHWRQPESVILDWDSYQQIARADQYRGDLAAFWMLNTWIYIGCGPSGLDDPDLGLLLQRYGQRARQAGHLDFCLVRSGERDAFDAFFKSKHLNILAVPYGPNHCDLAPYLRSLLPATAAVAESTSQCLPTNFHGYIPKPPAFYAKPDYIGSHEFVGRHSQLQELSDWATPADPTNLLLLEAIGGNGKSMLTWEWTTNAKHALALRSGEEAWAGRFWYSFYEDDADMADFCQHAVAYMTGQSLEGLRKKKTAELKEALLAQLHTRPWLLILDGLERVLVAYHRFDAADVPDEEVNTPIDKIANRNPRDAIHDEDGDLLYALAAARPSKILVSSRLTPRVLLNPSDQPITGVKRINLPGLRPPDGVKLLRSCGVVGDSAVIQSYLTANCDNHPLVIGILGGLIMNYLPARGDFDTWVVAADGGAGFDLASLDLIQRRNQILRMAINALPSASRQLLSILALVPESVGYKTLEAFNPHIPAEPTHVADPDEDRGPLTEAEAKRREDAYRALSPDAKRMVDAERSEDNRQYWAAVQCRRLYLKTLADWQVIASSPAARTKLRETVRDLETRGLLQFDHRTSRYDLHPVVRASAIKLQQPEEMEAQGKRTVDHFSSMAHSPCRQAKSLEDVRPRMNVVRVLLKVGQIPQAANAFTHQLGMALLDNVDAPSESLSLLRPFFPHGWQTLPQGLERLKAYMLACHAAIALTHCDESMEAISAASACLSHAVATGYRAGATNHLRTIATGLESLNQLAGAARVTTQTLDLATTLGDQQQLFLSRLWCMRVHSLLGHWARADELWELLDPMGRGWSRDQYRPGMAEYVFALFQFWRGTLQKEHLDTAERLGTQGNSPVTVRRIQWLRGMWLLEQGSWEGAAASCREALRLARAAGATVGSCETGLALAKYHLGQLAEPRREVDRLARLRDSESRHLAQLWLALGEKELAKDCALTAYTRAWADGEPYVRRYELVQTTELLHQLGIPIPTLARYDEAKSARFPWEADVGIAIEALRGQLEASKS